MPAHRGPPPRLPRDYGSADPDSGIEQDLPSRLARVVPADFASTPTLSGIGSSDAFVTSADDIAGIETGEDLAFRLALLAEDGSLLTGAKAVIEFDAPDEGLACPVFRKNPGFVGRGRTVGGAREFVLPNLRVEQLRNVSVRFHKGEPMTTELKQELEGGEAVEFAAHHLRKVGVDAVNWQVIYEEPATGDQWVMDYPNSEAQGGGSPRLRRKV